MGKQPTSSQDPLGLRRQTLYIIEMLIRNEISAKVGQLLLDILPPIYQQKNPQKMVQDLVTFFKGRLATIFDKEDFNRKFINAALETDNENIFGLFLILGVLREFKDDERFLKVVDGFRRMNNIVKDFAQKNNNSIPEKTNEKLFELDPEKKLFEISGELRGMIDAVSGKSRKEYEDIFNYMASIKVDIDNFFDNVMVMHENADVKMNRLAILNRTVRSVKTLINIEMLQ